MLALHLLVAASIASSATNCLRYNANDCRNFDLVSFNSTEIDTVLTIGNETNMPIEMAQDFAGLWYMNGNPLADEVISMHLMTKLNNKYYLKVYDEQSFTFDDNLPGRLLYDAVRTSGLVYEIERLHADSYIARPRFNFPAYLSGKTFTLGDYFAQFYINRTADANEWTRDSAFFNKKVSPYRFQRIVYGNGSRTDKWDGYVANIDSKVDGVTLGKKQLYSVAKK